MELYATDDHVFCLYLAPHERMMRELVLVSSFPVTAVREIRTWIDPTTAELNQRPSHKAHNHP